MCVCVCVYWIALTAAPGRLVPQGGSVAGPTPRTWTSWASRLGPLLSLSSLHLSLVALVALVALDLSGHLISLHL